MALDSDTVETVYKVAICTRETLYVDLLNHWPKLSLVGHIWTKLTLNLVSILLKMSCSPPVLRLICHFIEAKAASFINHKVPQDPCRLIFDSSVIRPSYVAWIQKLRSEFVNGRYCTHSRHPPSNCTIPCRRTRLCDPLSHAHAALAFNVNCQSHVRPRFAFSFWDILCFR